MSARTFVAAVAAAVVVSSCAFAPGRAPRPALVAAHGLGLDSRAAPAIPERWWHAFGDSRLDALVDQATRDGPSLAAALARLEHARSDVVAAGADRKPHVDASGTVLRERYSARYIIPPPYGGGSYTDSQVDLSLSYQLDVWGRQSARLRAAERLAGARELDAHAAELALQGAVVTAYLELDHRYALADLARDAEAMRTRLAALTHRRVEAGLDTGIDLRNADAALPESRVDREQAAAAVEISVHRLAALAGQGAAAYAGIGRPSIDYGARLALPAVIPGDLLARRPDVRAALARVDAASASEDAARLAAYPAINLQAFAGLAAVTLGDLLSAPARTYGFGPAVRLPIFDAGVLRAQYRRAGADRDAAVADYNSTVLDAVREVADAITRIDTLGREVRNADERLALLVEAERLADERFHGGLADQLTVLDAKLRVNAGRRTLATAQALEAEARVVLTVALGGGLPPSLPTPPASAKALP